MGEGATPMVQAAGANEFLGGSGSFLSAVVAIVEDTTQVENVQIQRLLDLFQGRIPDGFARARLLVGQRRHRSQRVHHKAKLLVETFGQVTRLLQIAA